MKMPTRTSPKLMIAETRISFQVLVSVHLNLPKFKTTGSDGVENSHAEDDPGC